VATQTSENPAFREAAARSARDAGVRAEGGREGALGVVRSQRVAWAALAVTCALACAVFWAFEALPFQDLPAHAGLIALRSRIDASPIDRHYFVYAPHVGPYTLFRCLGEVFGRVLGPLAAVRLLATLPIITMPLALMTARRRLHGEWSPTYGFLGIVLSFGFMTLLGFASYQLGLSILVFTLPLWLAHAEKAGGAGRAKDEIFLSGLCLLLFVAHGHAFLLFNLIVGVSLLVPLRASLLTRLRAVRPVIPALSLAAGVAFWERGHAVPQGAAAVDAHMTTLFQGALDKFSLLITPTLMTRSGVDFFIGIVIWLWTLALLGRIVASVIRGKASLAARRLILASLVLFGAFAALPHNIRWFGFVDGRLVPLLLLLPALAAPPNLLGPIAAGLERRVAPLVAMAMVVSALVASYRFQDEARGYKEVLGRVPAAARLLNLPLDPNSDVFTAHPFVHYDKLIMVDRPSVPSDVWFHQGSAVYPTEANPALRLPENYVESDLKGIQWQAYDLHDWDYVLVRTRPDGTLHDVPGSLSLVEHRGGWWLYRRTL